jgi:ATP-binding cassette subfamily B protein
MPLMMFTSGLGAVIVLWLGGRQVIQGSLTLGEFVAFNSYLSMLIFPMMAIGWVINLFQRGAASLDRIAHILDEPPQEEKPVVSRQSSVISQFRGQLEFRNLSFSYEKNRWILKDINLVIPAGSTLGIVGPVGAGKTTLANLIPRLLEVTKGELLLDGVEVQRLPLKQLRKLVGYVPQESFLFSASLKENILYGLDSLPPDGDGMERILRVSRIAELLQEAESFPEKFDTQLGERGITLSGGQRQRTALARALVREPKILILDDAFASVDTFTEGRILNHLKPFMAERTCIIISHRVSTLKDADCIIVLQDGQIAEQGRHEELLQNDGFYAQIYRKQLLLEAIRKEG